MLAVLIATFAVPTSLGQTSASYSLEEATLNAGGRPQNSSSPSSASYGISAEAIGDFVVSRGLSSASYVSDASFLVAYPSPREVLGLDIAADKQTVTWQPEPSVGRYNVYRGALTGISGLTYGDCLQQDLATETTSDTDLPPLADGFYYIVTAENRLHEEGTKGDRSDGIERQGTACP